jgi:hypothetical protein
MHALLCVVLLAEIHHDLVPESLVKRLFGSEDVKTFSQTFPELRCKQGYFGKGSRMEADRRRSISERKLREARRLAGIFRCIPWIKFAGVSGSISFGNADARDDIDMTLVVSKHRLWLSRLFEQGIFRLLRVRRKYRDNDVSNKVCVNLYLSEEELDLRHSLDGDICTALELSVLKPMYNDDFYSRFVAKNQWIRQYFPAIQIDEGEDTQNRRIPFVSWVGDGIDTIAMWVQLFYMRVMRHHSELSFMSPHRIHFFPKDRWDGKKKLLKKQLQRYDLDRRTNTFGDIVD